MPLLVLPLETQTLHHRAQKKKHRKQQNYLDKPEREWKQKKRTKTQTTTKFVGFKERWK